MPVDIAQLAGGALGGAAASSVLALTIGQGKERRELRAKVLQCIGELEQKRWADSSLQGFREAVLALRAAALIAGAHHDVVDHYVFLARVARRASDQAMEQSGGEASGIPTELFALVEGAASLVVDHLWHPYRKRIAITRGLKKNRSVERSLREDADLERMDWSPPLVYG